MTITNLKVIKMTKNIFKSKGFSKLISDEMSKLGDIPKSEKMKSICETMSYTEIINGVETIHHPFTVDDIFVVELSERLDISQRELDIFHIIKHMDYSLTNLKLLKRLRTEILSYSDVVNLTNYLKLLDKYGNMDFFLTSNGMTVKQYNKNLKKLKFDNEETLL